jgi:hypothetical protein
MQATNLNGLFECVRAGESGAADQLHRLLRPVVSRTVRRILDAGDYGTPLGDRVRALRAEIEPPEASEDLDATAAVITREICRQTVARLETGAWTPRHAFETVLA